VFSTLHTKTPAQGIDRIVDVFPPHQQQQVRVQLANVLHSIVTQQLLVRKDGDGLVVAVEQLVASPAVRNLIREGKTFQLQSVLHDRGLISYDDALEHAFDPRELNRLMGRG
jgi:twitching motility protein PilT